MATSFKMSDSIRIVPMEYAHWAECRRIYQAGIDTGLATFETEAPEWLAWDEAHLQVPRLVVLVDETVAGFAALSPVSRRACYAGVAELSIYTQRGRGLGVPLLREIVRQSEQAGLWTVQATIFAENAASIRAHQAAGFRMVGRRERIAQREGVWRDTVLLERRSLSEPHVYETSVAIDAPQEAVMSVLSTAEGLRRWYAPVVRIDGGDLEVSWGPGMEGGSKLVVDEGRVRWEEPSGFSEFVVSPGEVRLRAETGSPGAKLCYPHAWPLFLEALRNAVTRAPGPFENICVFRTTRAKTDVVFARVLDALRDVEVRIRRLDPAGYAAFELCSPGRSWLCVFAEASGGDTALTLMWLLSGPDVEMADALRRDWQAIADELTR